MLPKMFTLKLGKLSMAPVHVLFFFVLFSYHVLAKEHGNCPPSFDCGNLGKIHFPFTDQDHPDCGLLVIHGCNDREPDAVKTIKNNATWFYVVGLSQFIITIRNDDLRTLLLSRRCGAFFNNRTFITTSTFFSFHMNNPVTLFRCNSNLNVVPPISYFNFTMCPDDVIFYDTSGDDESSSLDYRRYFSACSMVQLPIGNQGLNPNSSSDLFDLVSANTSIQVQLSSDCSSCYYLKGGQCQLDTQGKFFCAKDKARKKVYIVIAATSAASALGVLMVLACYFRRWFSNKENPTHQIIETFLKQHGHLSARRYSYLEVKKMTNSFRTILGKGGYGSVYKGRLHDGSLVAVKILSQLEGNGEEFINEVASISMTSHVNIVSLLGFCLEGSKRALIYEYMPNGSLEKFIYEEKDSLKLNLRLNCKTMYNIALGVARGLEYLHRGCNTRILHFDIKPHNILLDEDFCPKISDFGLAKICPRKESIVSLLGTRGTAGYIAPEVFSRNFGVVSHKSDVYSYGMMVLEMVGARENINVKVEYSSSEKYFPHWIYSRLELNQNMELGSIKNQSDEERVKKMTIVSLWCIQIDPSNRPAMSKVVEMMEGSLESLQVPPKPVLSSPSKFSAPHQTETSELTSSFYESTNIE